MALGETLVSARSLAEYSAMFGLSAADLDRSLVDCPGGAASFGAEVRSRGGRVVSVDPAYRLGLAELATVAHADVERGSRYVADHAGEYTWGFFRSVDDHRAGRQAAANRFMEDTTGQGGGTYIAAALPRLPFADGTFDLALSSHLLFIYADRLDVDFHWAALGELGRVSRREVRVFPIVDLSGNRYDRLDDLRRRLEASGVGSEVRSVDYRFAPGATEMLVVQGGPVPGYDG